MFAVIYRFKLQEHQEKLYIECWHRIVNFFKEKKGAIGSCLHKSDGGIWIAYSRWPDRATRDASWPGDNAPNTDLPNDIVTTIKMMQAIKAENKHLEQFEEICLEVISDKLSSAESIQ